MNYSDSWQFPATLSAFFFFVEFFLSVSSVYLVFFSYKFFVDSKFIIVILFVILLVIRILFIKRNRILHKLHDSHWTCLHEMIGKSDGVIVYMASWTVNQGVSQIFVNILKKRNSILISGVESVFICVFQRCINNVD